MADTINIENAGTEKQEVWITIKDASDLLGISERHAWRVIGDNAIETQKKVNQDRKKTYVKRSEIEQYHKAEQERQRLAQLETSTPLSDLSDIAETMSDKGLSDKSDIKVKPMSDIKNLPILLSDYRGMIAELHKKQEQMIKDAIRWKTTANWLIVLMLFICLFWGFYLYDTKKAMSDIKTEMSDRVNALSDKVETTRADLLNTKEELFKRDLYIQKLEQSIPERELEKLKGQETQK